MLSSTQTCERVLRDTGVYVYRGEEADCTSEHVFVMTQQEKQLQLNAAAINAARITFICYSEHTHTHFVVVWSTGVLLTCSLPH